MCFYWPSRNYLVSLACACLGTSCCTLASLEFQMNCENQIRINESQVTWLQLITQPLEFQISWQPNHLNFKSIDIQIIGISNHLTTKPPESQIIRHPNHLNLKKRWTSKPEIKWRSKSVDNQATWTATGVNLTSIDFRINAAHIFPIGSLWLETSATALRGPYVMSKIVKKKGEINFGKFEVQYHSFKTTMMGFVMVCSARATLWTKSRTWSCMAPQQLDTNGGVPSTTARVQCQSAWSVWEKPTRTRRKLFFLTTCSKACWGKHWGPSGL